MRKQSQCNRKSIRKSKKNIQSANVVISGFATKSYYFYQKIKLEIETDITEVKTARFSKCGSYCLLGHALFEAANIERALVIDIALSHFLSLRT